MKHSRKYKCAHGDTKGGNMATRKRRNAMSLYDRNNFYTKNIPDKGRGVFTNTHFEAFTFLLPYEGNMLKNEPVGDDTYVFEFSFKGKKYWIDASEEDETFGRLINDDHVHPNCRPKVVDIDGKPVLCFYSICDIPKDTELTYNYGKGDCSDYPWRFKRPKRDFDREKLDGIPFVFMITGLKQKDLKAVKKLVKLIERKNSSVKFLETFSTEVTHLIVKTEPIGSRVCTRTLKYFQAVVNKCWILDFKWAVDCDVAECLLPEEDYEIVGDDGFCKLHYGPYLSRNSKSGLFKGYSFLLYGFREEGDLTGSNVRDLIEASDGKVIDVEKKIQTTQQEKMICICPFQIDEFPEKEIEIFSKYPENYEFVSYYWFLDSITGFKIQPVSCYIFDIDPHNIDVNQKMNSEQLSQETEMCNIADSTVITDTQPEPNQEQFAQKTEICQLDSTVITDTQPESNQEQFAQKTEICQLDSTVITDTQPEPNQEQFAQKTEICQLDNAGITDSQLRLDREQFAYETDVFNTLDNTVITDQPRPILEQLTKKVEVCRELDNAVTIPQRPAIFGRNGHKTRKRELSVKRHKNRTGEKPKTRKRNKPGFVKRISLRQFYKEDDSLSEYSDIVGEDDGDYIPHEESTSEYEESTSEYEESENEDHVYIPVSDTESEGSPSTVFPMLCNVKLTVQQSGKNTKGNLDNKKHVCAYCGIKFPNIARHLTLKHSNELEVAKCLSLKKKSKERRKMWEVIVNKGDFAHNYSVLEKGQGQLIPKYRTKQGAENSVNEYLPCQYCKGFYKRQDLWKHQKSCKSNIQDVSSNEYKLGAVAGGKSLLPVQEFVGKCLHDNILINMNEDKVTLAVKSDPMIIDLGNRLYEEHGKDPHKHSYISQKMRELGRLVLQLKENGLSCIEKCFESQNWDVLINSVREVAGYDGSKSEFGIPSLALKIGHSLKRCAENLYFKSLKNGDKDKSENMQTYLNMYKLEWKSAIASKAHSTLATRKYNKPQVLPLVEDVQKLHSYLNKRAEEVRKLLKDNVQEFYPELAKLCLAQIILFNRKRSGEAQRMTVKGFMDAKIGGQIDSVVRSTLSCFEQKLCDSHMRVEIVGKRGQKVPVLLTEQMKSNIMILFEQRQAAGVTDEVYLFAKPTSLKQLNKESKFPYRGSDSLREFAQKCGAKHPEYITSTKLRKQLATLAQILNLKENSQDILATFQGHDIRVHRKFYRLPDDALQLAKVSRLLHCINNGSVHKYKGCDFEDIQFEENDTVESESEESDMEDSIGDTDLMDTTCIYKQTEMVIQNDVEDKEVMTNPEKYKNQKDAKHAWTFEEKEALNRHFVKTIRLLKVPGKMECLNAIKTEQCLAKYMNDWKKIKYAVYNLVMKRKRIKTKDRS